MQTRGIYKKDRNNNKPRLARATKTKEKEKKKKPAFKFKTPDVRTFRPATSLKP